jgi:FkbM family methyltransferase
MKYCSQHKQDEIVLEILGHRLFEGFFVEIGANDGKTLSNTYVMETYLGWNGICVEPDYRVIDKLRENRSCLIDTRPITLQSGHESIFYHDKDPMLSMFLLPEAKLAYADGTLIDTSGANFKTMKGISINDLLKDYNAPREIDYISMDIEGTEAHVLNTFNFGYYNVKCWTIEWKNCSGHLESMLNNKVNIANTLLENGYSIKEHETDIIGWK